MKKRDIATRAMSVILSVTLAAANCPVYSLAGDAEADVYVEAAAGDTAGEETLEEGSGEELLAPELSEAESQETDEASEEDLLLPSDTAEEGQGEDGGEADIFVELVEEIGSLEEPAELLGSGDEGDGAKVSENAYVMMNIPYDVYYGAVAGVSSDVDAVSSATASKWKNQTGTFYETSGSGGRILGVTVPVKVEDDAALTELSAQKAESGEISGAGAYAYYVPEASESVNYILKMDAKGSLTAPEAGPQTLAGASAEIAYSSNYGDYQLTVSGIENIGTVYGVTLTTEEKTYALRHLQNIWRGGSQLAWSVGKKVTESHGNSLDYAQYADMQGRTITAVTYYTDTGVYTVPAALLVKKKADVTVTVEPGSAGSGSVAVSLSGELPAGFTPSYSVASPEGPVNMEYSGGYLEYLYTAPGNYTLTISDESGIYCDLTAGFVLSTADRPAVYDPENNALVKADGFTNSQLKAYLKSITAVAVDGVSYAASGRRSVTIINADGTLNTAAASQNTAVFGTTKEYAVTVAATGYEDLSFTYTKEPLTVMLNIPYSAYYSIILGTESQVDAVSSATTSKWQNENLVGGTYHKAAESGNGGQILGVTVPVRVKAEEIPAAWTKADSQSAADYSYYPASGDTGAHLIYENGGLKLASTDRTVLTGASGEMAYSSRYGDCQLTMSGTDGIGTVYGVTLTTAEKTYALRHLENIWRGGSQLAWSVGVNTQEAHGNPLAYGQYEDMQGRTITAVTYYTSTGIYEVPANIPVKRKTGLTAAAEDGTAGNGSIEVTLDGDLPGDFEAEYTVEGLKTVYSEGTLSYTGAAAGSYTLTVSDRSGNYCELTAAFKLSTQEIPVKYDGDAHALVAAEGYTQEQLESYLKNISSVTVGETSYPASGKRPVTIIDRDGSLNFYAASNGGAIFTSGEEYKICVSASGYEEDLEFTAVPAPKYGTMTMRYAEFYNGLAKGADGIDAVSSATTGKSTMFGNADSTQVTEDGYQILGVKNVPVEVEPGASAELVKRVDFKENPYTKADGAQYWTVDAKGISMDTASLQVADTVTDAEVTLSTSSNWGEYEITVKETTTKHLRDSRTDEGFDVGSGILGVLVTTQEGDSYGLTHMNNIWVQPYKFAFSPSKSTALAGLVNKKISSITYIMPDAAYVYKVAGGLYIKPAYAGEAITGAFSGDGTTFTLDEQVSGLENAAITVTYKEGRNTKTLLPSTEVGTETAFTLETAVPENTVPAVTISSDNYADITVSYPMFAFQKEKLETLTDRAEALLAYSESDILKAHVEEAKELLENISGTAQAAAELITELTSLIGSAEKALTLEVDGKDVSSLISMSSLWNEETGSYDISQLDLTNTEVFAQGAEGAYLFTLGEDTRVVGDTSLARWAGNWENWQIYVRPSASTAKRYPLLDEVWNLAYDGFIASFGGSIQSAYPNTDSLKNHWYEMTRTYSGENAATVSSMTVQKTDGGYALSWIDASGRTLAKSDYFITGKLNNGLEGAVMYVLTAKDLKEGSPFKYLVTMEPDYETTGDQPVAGHYHFQYGSSLEALLYHEQHYTGTETNIRDEKWYATMTNSDASDIAKYNVILSMHRTDKWTEGDLSLAKAELAETAYTADGSVRRPEVVSVKTASGRAVPEDYYKVSYGTAAKEPGTYTVTITAKEGYEGSVTATFTITEKAASSGQPDSSNGGTNISGGTETGTGTGTTTPVITVKNATKLKVKSTAKKKVKVTWKKRSGVSGYQIQYSTSKKFKTATTKKVSAKKRSCTIRKLKSKKTYYVRIRAYKTVDGKKYYSSWSKAKKVKVK